MLVAVPPVVRRPLTGSGRPCATTRSTPFNTVALTVAFFVKAAILILAAVVLFGHDKVTLSSGQVITFSSDSDWIQVAYVTLALLVGKIAASLLFAVALLASGQSSTINGTLRRASGDGSDSLHWRIAPWLRLLVTRLCAIIPAVVLIGLRGDNSITDLLTLSSRCSLAIQFAVCDVSAADLRRLETPHGRGAHWRLFAW